MDQISDLNDLRLFAEVVDRGSFTAAGKALGLQTSKLSRRISALEEELGVRLLNRTSRSLSLTDTGRQFYQHCLALVSESKAAKQIVEEMRTLPQGTVRFSCPLNLMQSGVADDVALYIRDNPRVQVLVDATNRRVDVVKEGLDFAIRVRQLPLDDTDLAARKFGSSIFVLIASPALVKAHPPLVELATLSQWPTLDTASDDERYTWDLVNREGKKVVFHHHPRMATDDFASLRLAALQGVGACMLPREFVDADIQAGRLLHLLPELAARPGHVHAVFPRQRGMVPAVRRLLDVLVAGYQERHSGRDLYIGPQLW
ncbi:LysR substrate-binding domain-containing protein [Herbaspirillum sp. CF444]|uniref:LysR substrate-binding domain-containing protein n=1 Tax=Herbaspirillum sp. CF444 TaxID=1144319 RepID=UPI0002E51E1F|nr:LysR substrate-binding domain-containing protein [Herbaspirillum sp. CF444]